MHALDTAADFYAQAAALAAQENDPQLLGAIAEAMARVERQRDRPTQARELFENALTQYGAAGDRGRSDARTADLAQLDAERKRTRDTVN